jgi:hypothetical protein
VLLIILYFKESLAPPNYLIALQGTRDIFAKMLDSSRYVLVWEAFAREMVQFGGWAVSIPLLFIFYVLLVGVRVDVKNKLSVGTSIITLCSMLFGYSMIYVVSPIGLQLQLNTSLNRILLQLWPSFVFTYFLIVRPIEQVSIASEAAADAD